jgi:hypothetical protein
VAAFLTKAARISSGFKMTGADQKREIVIIGTPIPLF